MIISKIMRIAYLVVDRLEVFVTDTASKILKKLLSAAKSTIQLISKLATQIQTTLLSIVKSITKSMLPRIKSASIKLSNNTRSFVTSSTQRFRGLFHKCLSATTKLLSNITRTLFKSIASAVYFFINSIVNLLSKFFITCRKLLRYSTIKKILSIKINTKPFTDAIKNITLKSLRSTATVVTKLYYALRPVALSCYHEIKKILNIKINTKPFADAIKNITLKSLRSTATVVTKLYYALRSIALSCYHGIRKILNIKISTKPFTDAIKSITLKPLMSIATVMTKLCCALRSVPLSCHHGIRKILNIKINTKPFTDAIKNITLKPLRSIATVVTKLYYALRSIPLSCYHGIRKILSIKINTKPFTNAIKNITIFAVSSACIILTVGLVKEYRQPIAKILASTQGNANPPKNEYDLSKDQKIYVANSLITPKRKAKHLFRDPVEIKQRTVTEAILALKIDSIQRTANNKGNIQIGNKFYSIGAIINDHPRLKLAKITTNNVKFSDKYGYIYKRRIDDLIE